MIVCHCFCEEEKRVRWKPNESFRNPDARMLPQLRSGVQACSEESRQCHVPLSDSCSRPASHEHLNKAQSNINPTEIAIHGFE